MKSSIPDFLLNNSKKGWVSPISKWLREDLQEMAYEIINENYVSGTDEFINFKEEVYDEIKDIEGSLIIKEYPTKSESTNTIKSHLSSDNA